MFFPLIMENKKYKIKPGFGFIRVSSVSPRPLR
jgi:hypothetical protein